MWRATSSQKTAGATIRPPTCRPVLRQARLAYAATDVVAHGRLRRQRAERQRPAGAALPRPRLRECLHEAGHDRQSLACSESHARGTASSERADVLRQCLLPRHQDRRRSTATSTRIRSTRRLSADAAEQAALAAAGYTGFPTSGANAVEHAVSRSGAASRNVLLNDEPEREVQRPAQPHAHRQHNYGLSGQVTWRDVAGGHRNQFTVGRGLRRQHAHFTQSTELGYLNPDRSVTGVDAFGDGVTGGTSIGEPVRHARRSRRPHPHVQPLCDRHAVARRRVARSRCPAATTARRIDNRDRITPGGGPGRSTAHHAFGRFNPAAGVTFSPSRVARTSYFGLQRGQPRADVDRARLRRSEQPVQAAERDGRRSAARQVVTRNVEAGVRGASRRQLALERRACSAPTTVTTSCSSLDEQTGFGYFKNFGKTRRQGVELDVSGRIGRVQLRRELHVLDATYQSDGDRQRREQQHATTRRGARASKATSTIQPGDRIPLIPRHMLKAFADLAGHVEALARRRRAGVRPGSFARGNENNLHEPDGVYYLGPGKTPGYAVVNLGRGLSGPAAAAACSRRSTTCSTARYYTARSSAPTGSPTTGTFIARPFAAPVIDGELPLGTRRSTRRARSV